MQIHIGEHLLGDNCPIFLIAELSANHQHDLEIAKRSIIAAHEAGADAVKLQTYTADTITIDCDSPLFTLPAGTLWAGKTLYELYKEAYTPWEWHKELKDLANSLGMELFSSPFDPTAAEFLHSLDMPAYKIASFEIFDIPLIRHCAAFQKPMIISTGMADIAAIDEAVRACREVGNNDIVLLKCTSAYPAPIDKANIATIPFMKSTYGTLAGLSDHTVGDSVAAAATALGACMIEKHFILDHKMDSPDEAFSLDPAEFKQMAELVRNVERAVGKVTYAVQQETAAMRKLARSLFVTEDMAEGESFTAQNLRSIRPGDGLHPRYLPDLLGKKARKAIKKGTPMSWLLVD